MSVASLDTARWLRSSTVLLDIEGTISSISFVKDVLSEGRVITTNRLDSRPARLYPYALDRLTRLARDSWDDAAFHDLIAGFPEETRQDADTLIAHVEDLTRNDIKATYLKQLQGNLWKTGYSDGDLKTPLFDDVIPTLQRWKEAGKTLAIFSSGSVQAQLQFFSYVENGTSIQDLKPLFSAHFDTVTAGPKLEKASYEKIARELGKNAADITFLTDNVKEAAAANEAAIYTVLLDRPGNAALSADSRSRFPVAERLTDLPHPAQA